MADCFDLTNEERNLIRDNIEKLANEAGYTVEKNAFEVGASGNTQSVHVYGVPGYNGFIDYYTVISNNHYEEEVWEVEKLDDGSYHLGEKIENKVGDGGSCVWLSFITLLNNKIPIMGLKADKVKFEKAKEQILADFNKVFPSSILEQISSLLKGIEKASTPKELNSAVLGILWHLDDNNFEMDLLNPWNERIGFEKVIR